MVNLELTVWMYLWAPGFHLAGLDLQSLQFRTIISIGYVTVKVMDINHSILCSSHSRSFYSFVRLGTLRPLLHLVAILKLFWDSWPLKDDSSMLANWYTYVAEAVAKDINEYWKKREKQYENPGAGNDIKQKRRLLLWAHGHFASGDAYIWHASRACAQSPTFTSAKI